MTKVTIKDVAKAAGVSYATVSRAYSGSSGISEETRERIIRVGNDMGYTPNIVARSMVKRETNTIGLIIPAIENPYMSEFTGYLEARARQVGYNIMVCSSGYNLELEKDALQLLVGKQVDGIIIMPVESDSSKSVHMLTGGIPSVFVGENGADQNDYQVYVDNFTGTKLGTEYLYSLGHKKIVYLGYRKDSQTHKRRLEGYLAACSELELEPEILNNNFRRSSQQAGYMIGKLYFSRPREHTAIFCASDVLAIGVMQAADEVGVRIPEDVSVMGYDNVSFTALPRIDLTTVDQSLKEMADASFMMLLEQIMGEEKRDVKKALMPVIVERGTCRMIGC